MQPRVILYELNEVPWEIVDLYVSSRPSSNLARLLPVSTSLTTSDDDPVSLQPWRTWPTFHKSLYADDHRSFELGQDPTTFQGDDLWDVVDRAQLTVGLFGPLQSWPPRSFGAGGFHVPDTFSRSAETNPSSLRRFQAFNLTMTQRNGFSSDAPLDRHELALAGLDLLPRGLTAWSARWIASQLIGERRDERLRARRPVVQVLPAFDLYWRLHRRHRPHLSVFFTNHVAAMMHRYWGDGVPGYAETNQYTADPVVGGFVLTAMDLFDRQLGRVLRHVDRNPETVIVIASSMGQGPIEQDKIDDTYVLDHAERLMANLGMTQAELGLAMYPRICLMFPDGPSACAAVSTIESVKVDQSPVFRDIRVLGTSVSFEIVYRFNGRRPSREVAYRPSDATKSVIGDVSDLGISIRRRLGGGNTAYHTREGILIAHGRGLAPDPSRRIVDVLDAAPSILELLGLAPATSMRGSPTLFAESVA